MAQYKDVDAFKQKLADKDIFFPALYANELNEMPAADVVPKSEVEKLIELNKVQRKRNMHRASEITATRIFEEIDKYTQEKKKAISMFKDGEDDFYDGEIHALDVFEHFLAELKKKYTENAIVGEWKFDEKLHTEQPDLSNVKFIDEDGNITNRDDALDWNETSPYEESEGNDGNT